MYKTKDELRKDLIAQRGSLSGIYKITRKSDGKIYIGQSENIVDRIMQHIDNKSETNSEKIDGAIAAAADKLNDFSYEVELALPMLNTEQLWVAEGDYIAKYDSYNNGFNKTKGNHIGKYDHDAFVRKHVVSADVTKFIRDHFKLDYSKKKVLLINLFDEQFVNVLKYRDCEVYQISKYFEDEKDLAAYIMEELKKIDMKFDLIIANPPYGKTGANITKTIIDNIEYDEFVNLLPANDYIRNDDKDLYKYVELDTMKALPKELKFKDAVVTTYVAKISKKPRRYLSWEEFQIENYIDDSLTKYFYELRNREHYAIAVATAGAPKDINFDSSKSIFINHRDPANKHFAYTKNCAAYQINNNLLTYEDAWKSFGLVNDKSKRLFDAGMIHFNSVAEKLNLAAFLYSKDGFRFISKILTAINVDSWAGADKYIPRVDWTRAWTVEEILADYGYTQGEIDEVMVDLPNYKGMED